MEKITPRINSTKTAHRGRIQVNVFPYRGFKVQVSHLGRAQGRSLTPLCREVYKISLTRALTARFDIVSIFCGRKYRPRCCRFSTVCCLRRNLTQRQLLKLQSRTADKKYPRRKRPIWRGRRTISPAKRSTTSGAILIWIRPYHSHSLESNLYVWCCCCCLGGGGGGGCNVIGLTFFDLQGFVFVKSLSEFCCIRIEVTALK